MPADALNERVAMALGWTRHVAPRSTAIYWTRPGSKWKNHTPPCATAEPRTPEAAVLVSDMEAFLEDHPNVVGWTLNYESSNERPYWVSVWFNDRENYGMDESVDPNSATKLEALALAVAAVAEKEAE